MEFFEALKTFRIMTLDGIKEVTGTKITDEYFAYKDSVRSMSWWYVVDTASGLAISPQLKTLQECRAFVKELSLEIIAKIEAIRLEPKYKEQCANIAAWQPEQVEDLSFNEAFEALNELYESTIEIKSIEEL